MEDKAAEVIASLSCPNPTPERLRQITTLRWIRQIIQISTTKGLYLRPLVASLLSAVLPCLDDREDMEDRSEGFQLFYYGYIILSSISTC